MLSDINIYEPFDAGKLMEEIGRTADRGAYSEIENFLIGIGICSTSNLLLLIFLTYPYRDKLPRYEFFAQRAMSAVGNRSSLERLMFQYCLKQCRELRLFINESNVALFPEFTRSPV